VFEHFDGGFCYVVEEGVAEAGGHELNGATSGASGALCH
jgi:hypothetical protein